jgi:hypothetical protein
MSKVKIYKVTCTKAYQMAEQGEGFSLTPWGKDTEYYDGFDDGGKDYELPDGFKLAQTIDGTPAIYKGKDHYYLVKYYNNPMLTNGFDSIVLKQVQ